MVVRTNGAPAEAARLLLSAARSVDNTLSPSTLLLSDALEKRIADPRQAATIAAMLGLCALLLAVIGLSGMVAFTVSQRMREIGIRLALGAERARVVGMMIAQAMSAIIMGIVAGLAGAWAATRLMASLLYGVQPHDAATFTTVTLMLAVVALIACAAPALRAAFVDPVVALRAE